MGFDTKKFGKEKFTPREQDVPVPDLKDYFGDGEPAVWRVRGLTGIEIGQSAEASSRNQTMISILEGLTSTSSKDKVDAVKNLIGLGSDAPQDVAKRIEHLVLASINPVCTQDIAVKLCEAFPIEFYQITNTIMELTGKGKMPGKQMPSGTMKESEPVSPSVIPEGDSSTK